MTAPREEHWIYLPCPCGKGYDSFCGYRDENEPLTANNPNGKYRFHKCPNCGHVWDLRPDLPKPAKVIDAKQARRATLLSAAVKGVK